MRRPVAMRGRTGMTSALVVALALAGAPKVAAVDMADATEALAAATAISSWESIGVSERA